MEAAIFDDCINLIEQFTENENPRFESFCAQWKSMMFHHIYSPQTSTTEIIQTTRCILHLAKRIVCAKDDVGIVVSRTQGSEQQLLRRIGGMFLMYAVYYKQPTKHYVKILVSLETWREIVSFIESMHPTDHLMDEVRYIFWRLYRSDAFRFTALDFEMGLEDMVDYDTLYDVHRGKEKAEVVRVKLKLKLQAITDTEKVLPEMTELEDKYNDVKQSLAVSQKSIKKALPPTNIFHDIQDVMENIQNILDEKAEKDKTKSTCSSSGNYSDKRKELKRKAAGIRDSTSESEETNEDDDSEVQEPPSQVSEKINRHLQKKSIRNIIKEKLPDDIIEDLYNSSSQGDITGEDDSGEGENLDESDDDMASTSQSNLAI